MSKKEGHNGDENLESIEHVLTDSEKFVEKNQKIIINAVAGVLLVILAVMSYNRFIMEPKEIDAQSQLFAGEMLFEKDSFQLAVEGDGTFMGFEYIVDKYGATPSGNLAKYYAGISYSKMGEYDKAIDFLSKFDADSEMMAPIKEGAIGDCYVELGDFNKAISAFKKAASYDNDFTAPIYLKKCGIAYEANGNATEAMKCYEKIQEKYPNSGEASDVKKYIARIAAK